MGAGPPGGRHRPQALRRRAGHPGGGAGPVRVHLRGPLAAARPRPAAIPVPLPAPAARLQQAAAGLRRPGPARHPGVGRRHHAVDRRRVGRRLHPGRVRSLPGDGATLGAGRLGRVRLLRLPLPLLLGAAAAPAVHAGRPARRLRAHRRQSRRTPDAAGHLRRRPRPGRRPARPILIGDKNYYGREFETALDQAGVRLLRPARKGESDRAGARWSSPCARPSSRSTRPSKVSSTWNDTAGTPLLACSSASCNASSR